MQDYGLLVHPVPPSLVAAWEERARLGYPRIIGAVVPPDLVAKVERLRDEYRASGGGR